MQLAIFLIEHAFAPSRIIEAGARRAQRVHRTTPWRLLRGRDAHLARLRGVRLQIGDSPERILERYPLLDRPSRVYGAIAFYLDHQAEIDAYLEAGKREFEASTDVPLSESSPALWDKLQQARAKMGEPRP